MIALYMLYMHSGQMVQCIQNCLQVRFLAWASTDPKAAALRAMAWEIRGARAERDIVSQDQSYSCIVVKL